MKKQISFLSFLLVLGSIGMIAQPGPRGGHRGPKGPMPEEVKAYVQENVLPVVEAQRAKLDAELSDQELADVASIRGGLQMLKEEQKSLRTSLKELRESHEGEGRPDIPDELRESMKELGKTKRQLMTQAWEIVDANEEEIESLIEELEPQAEQWKEDIRELVGANRSDGERRGNRKRGKGRSEMGRGPDRGMGGPFGNFHHPVAFLLFDASLLEGEELGSAELSVFPNPTQSQNTLEYTVDQPGDVAITLLDKSGKTIKQLVSTPKEAGTYRVSVDLTDLRPGLYVYRIETAGGTQTKKLLVE